MAGSNSDQAGAGEVISTNMRCRKINPLIEVACGLAIWEEGRKFGGSEVRAAQDSCSQVVNEVSSPGGAVQQPGRHILQPLGQADASGSAGLSDPPPVPPSDVKR